VDEGDRIRGFIVETDRPGFKADDVHGKWSLRASVTSGFAMSDVRVPASNILPKTEGLKNALMCLNQARYGIAWGAVADRWLSPRSMLGLLGLMMALSGVGVASLSADWPLPLVIFLSALFGASAVGWNGVYLAEVARRAPSGQVGALTGGTQFFTFIGALSAPPLFGFVAGLAGGYGKAYLAFCLLPALAGLRLLLGAGSAPRGNECAKP